jgi:hypothetical protein
MAKIVCTKCGATGDSKCPYCRTVFPDNQIEARLSYSLKIDYANDPRGRRWLKVELYSPINDENEVPVTIADDVKELYKILDLMVKHEKSWPTIEQYVCSHQWEFAPGCKSDINCGHPYKN